VAKSGRAAGRGVATGTKNDDTVEEFPELSVIMIEGEPDWNAVVLT
jgi:hypothetical protein